MQQHVFQFHLLKCSVPSPPKYGKPTSAIYPDYPAGSVAARFLRQFCRRLLKIPFALLAPAEANRTVRRTISPLVLKATVFHSGLFSWPAHQPDQQRATYDLQRSNRRFFQHHQHRHVSVATHIVGEIWLGLSRWNSRSITWPIASAMPHRCPVSVPATDRTVWRFQVVWCDGNSFGAFVTHFSKEVASGVRVCGTFEPQAMM